MRRIFVALGMTSALFATGPAALAEEAGASSIENGAAVYKRCAACHLPSGAGVPGAFPPLAGRLSAIAASDEGRAYIVMAVSSGLMGEIDVDGAKFRGFMPAQAGVSPEQIADVLNYTMTLKIGDAAAATTAAAFTAAEIEAIQASHPASTPNKVHAMRGPAFAGAASQNAIKADDLQANEAEAESPEGTEK
jgi:mono/diheme cytochrome c family protein